MTDAEKMDRLMEKHAAKASKPGEQPLKDLVDVWELDDRDAKLVCPQCGKARTAKVPKSWWLLAERRGEENPFWKSPCDSCLEAEEDSLKSLCKPQAQKVSEALELELPTEERG